MGQCGWCSNGGGQTELSTVCLDRFRLALASFLPFSHTREKEVGETECGSQMASRTNKSFVSRRLFVIQFTEPRRSDYQSGRKGE